MRIKEVIAEKGTTAKEVAAKMVPPITPESLSNAINGNPTVETLERIAAALGVPISELFEEKNRPATTVCPYCGHELSVKIE